MFVSVSLAEENTEHLKKDLDKLAAFTQKLLDGVKKFFTAKEVTKNIRQSR